MGSWPMNSETKQGSAMSNEPDDLIERLSLHTTWRDSHGELNDAPNQARDQLEAYKAEIEALRQALKPFAVAYEDEGDGDAFENRHNLWEHPAALDLTIGHLRQARTLIKQDGRL